MRHALNAVIASLLVAGVLYAAGEGKQTVTGDQIVKGKTDLSAGTMVPPEKAYASLPAAASCSGCVFVVTDAATAGSCAAGSGTARAWCRSTGSAYEAVGDGSGAAAGTVNSGAGKGWKEPFPIWGYQDASTVVAANANRGYIIQNLNLAQTEWRKVSFRTGTVTDNGKGFKVCVWAADRTSLLAESTVYLFTAGTSVDASVTWASGSAVSGGVFTEPTGVTWWGITTDSTTATLMATTGPPVAATTALKNEVRLFYTNNTISSLTGASLACTANISTVGDGAIGKLFQLVVTN